MSADKYPCIFSRQMAAIVYISLVLSLQGDVKSSLRATANLCKIEKSNNLVQTPRPIRTRKEPHSGGQET